MCLGRAVKNVPSFLLIVDQYKRSANCKPGERRISLSLSVSPHFLLTRIVACGKLFFWERCYTAKNDDLTACYENSWKKHFLLGMTSNLLPVGRHTFKQAKKLLDCSHCPFLGATVFFMRVFLLLRKRRPRRRRKRGERVIDHPESSILMFFRVNYMFFNAYMQSLHFQIIQFHLLLY